MTYLFSQYKKFVELFSAKIPDMFMSTTNYSFLLRIKYTKRGVFPLEKGKCH